jgi:hypothetical protein
MHRYSLLILLSIILFLSESCGTTQLIAGDGSSSIYVNNNMAGRGFAEVRRTGFPKRLFIETRQNGSKTGEIIVPRKFTFLTFFAGVYSYGIAALFTFQYPQQVYIPVNRLIYGHSAWDRPAEKSIWEVPASER